MNDPCPVCGFRRRKEICTRTEPSIYPDLAEDVHYERCFGCGLIGRYPLPPQSDLDKLYGAMYQPKNSRPGACYASVLEAVKTPIDGRSVKYDSAYDLGGHMGHVLECLKSDGLVKATQAGWLREDKWDLVLCLHVLEHISDLRTFICKLRDMVGHLLVVEVPDVSTGSFSDDICHKWHLWHWNPVALMQAIPMRCIKMERVAPLPGWSSLRGYFVPLLDPSPEEGLLRHLDQIEDRDEIAISILEENPGACVYGAGNSLRRIVEWSPKAIAGHLILDRHVKSVFGVQVEDPKLVLGGLDRVLLSVQHPLIQEEILADLHATYPHLAVIRMYP
jgi:hypothetical protein